MSADQLFPHSASSQTSFAFGSDAKSPRNAPPQDAPNQVPGRGPIPKFQKIKSVQELRPRVQTQPPFRRANPEGGFISVSLSITWSRVMTFSNSLSFLIKPLQALTTHLPSTYRICNPAFKYESSRNPRRVLTKPSKGVKNDGYDNEDSDYILYVNDILGSDEGHK